VGQAFSLGGTDDFVEISRRAGIRTILKTNFSPLIPGRWYHLAYYILDASASSK
jgi:hypothetical protein